MSSEEESRSGDIERSIIEAFSEAYPRIPEDDLVHMARNFTQVVEGLIVIGERMGGEEDVSHMDVANSIVSSCVANTFEEFQGDKSGSDTTFNIEADKMKILMEECVARVADWLLGLKVLEEVDPVSYRMFVRGAAAFGGGDWERNRGRIRY